MSQHLCGLQGYDPGRGDKCPGCHGGKEFGAQQSLLGVAQRVRTTDDYYTPEWVFDGMGLEFDLDPASPPGGVDYIPVERFLTKADDGLHAEWEGRVWLNPPFSEVSPWARKFIAHGNGVLLAPCSKAAWPSEVWNASRLVWLPRVSFKFGTPGQGRTDAGNQVPVSLFLAAMGDECAVALRRLAGQYPGALMRTA